MAYDAADGYVLLFSGGGQPADTWAYSAGVWTKIPTVLSPSPRAHASMFFDPIDNYLVLFGGVYGPSPGVVLGDTWTYFAGVWTNITSTAGPAPSPRYESAITYDPTLSGILLFGGSSGPSKYLNDTWEFRAGRWAKLDPTDSPRPRAGAGLAFDSADNCAVLFGGAGSNTTSGENQTLNDTWVFTGSTWNPVDYTATPPARWDATMSYDASDGYVVLFGGVVASSTLNDTWTYRDGAWSQPALVQAPPPRFAAGTAWDGSDGYLLLFGGLNVPSHSPIMDDTWEFGGGRWHALADYVNCSVQFSESGLRTGAPWQVSVGSTNYTTTESLLELELPNGTWNFSIASAGYRIASIPHFIGWHFYTIGGGYVAFSARFELATYPVMFTESGLPVDSTWYVNFTASPGGFVALNGSAAAGFSIPVSLVNGTYEYSIATTAKQFQTTNAANLSESDGSPALVAVNFAFAYTVSFSEAGLPLGTSWSVALGGVRLSSTSTTIDYSEPNGTHRYLISDVPGWHQATLPYFGCVNTSAANVTEPALAFYPVTYVVSFSESGLPSGSEWWVNLTSGGAFNSTGGSLLFCDSNGTYGYALAATNKSYFAAGGEFTIDGSAVSEMASFVLTTYNLTFTESGLPGGTTWSITSNERTLGSTTDTITFALGNGTYTYRLNTVPGYRASSANGSITVSGAPVKVRVTFTLAKYAVIFVESGLAAHTLWNVTLTPISGPPQEQNSTTTSIKFSEPNGTYTYSLGQTSGYRITNGLYGGSLTLSGASAPTIHVHWTRVAYAVTFSETGLPKGTSWSVTIEDLTKTGARSSLSFSLPNGTFSFTIVALGYSELSTPSSPLVVEGASMVVVVEFEP